MSGEGCGNRDADGGPQIAETTKSARPGEETVTDLGNGENVPGVLCSPRYLTYSTYKFASVIRHGGLEADFKPRPPVAQYDTKILNLNIQGNESKNMIPQGRHTALFNGGMPSAHQTP